MVYILDLWQFEQLYQFILKSTQKGIFFRWTCDYVAHQCFKNIIKTLSSVFVYGITVQLEFVKNS